jgi:Chemoreceptor zinc-binding domain
MLKNLLYDAMTVHVQCKICLNQSIDTGVCNPPSSVIRNERMCDFGKWLYSPALPNEVLDSAHYVNILRIHADFHEAAADVMQTIERNEIKRAKQMMAVDGYYTTHAIELRNEFLSWVAACETNDNEAKNKQLSLR